MRVRSFIWTLSFLTCCSVKAQLPKESMVIPSYKGPVIDMHIHADGADDLPPVSIALCPPFSTLMQS